MIANRSPSNRRSTSVSSVRAIADRPADGSIWSI
jgi:hypothetical protein